MKQKYRARVCSPFRCSFWGFITFQGVSIKAYGSVAVEKTIGRHGIPLHLPISLHSCKTGIWLCNRVLMRQQCLLFVTRKRLSGAGSLCFEPNVSVKEWHSVWSAQKLFRPGRQWSFNCHWSHMLWTTMINWIAFVSRFANLWCPLKHMMT